ncbi:MAG: ROK family protein [Proteobacteria bacterium]|nr:ROK family protein [Pseudomonadota bacterium]
MKFHKMDVKNANHTKGKGRPRSTETAVASLVDVINLVRLGQATTRQELERIGEYGRAIVADRLATLKDLDLVDENATGAAAGGRAPRLVQIRKDRARLAVVNLEQSSVGVGVADLTGKLVSEHHEIIDITDHYMTIDRIGALINWMMSRQPNTKDLWGISISVPGPVLTNSETPFLSQTPDFLPNWDKSGLVETLTQRFQAPVWMRSNIETMTMGEFFGGDGLGLQSMLFVKVGQRIGAGLINDGHLYHGSSGAVGLIGQLPVDYNNMTGTLDAMAGSGMIKAKGIAVAASGDSPLLADIMARTGDLSAIDVCQAAQMGDTASTEIVVQSGRLIGSVVATLANMLNPQLIVLAGSIAQSNDILLASFREAVYGASHPLVTRDMRILRSQMNNSAALLGASNIAVEALFDPPFLKDWLMLGSPTKHPEFLQSLSQATAKPPTIYDELPPPAAMERRSE